MNYVSFLYSHDKAKLFDLFSMLCPCTHDINPGRVDAAVSQNIRQFGNVLFDAVEGSGKEFSQIVGKHLCRLHLCSLASCFIFRQIQLRSSGFRLWPTKMGPSEIFLSFAYLSSIFLSFPGTRMVRVLLLQLTLIVPLFT